jgi:hypothetical protein
MITNNEIKARSEAKAKEERTTKLGLDVHAGQITVCRQQEGLLAQPAQRMSWERCLGWIQEQVATAGAAAQRGPAAGDGAQRAQPLRGHGLMLAQGFRAPSGWWKPVCWIEFGEQLPGWLREQVGLWLWHGDWPWICGAS